MKEEKKIWAVKDGYLVNRDGSIYALNWNRTGKMRKVKQYLGSDGYLRVAIHRKFYKAHRFIAECFIPNPYNLPQINHKDENKTNNCVDNLEWCDCKYNINYGNRTKKTCKKVYQYTLDGKFIKEWSSLHEIERKLGFFIQCIQNCCKGKQKTSYDYIWSYTPLNS